MLSSYTVVSWNQVLLLSNGTLTSTSMIIIVVLVSISSLSLMPTLVSFKSTIWE